MKNPENRGEVAVLVRGLTPDELVKAMKEGYEELKGTRLWEQYEQVKKTAALLSERD